MCTNYSNCIRRLTNHTCRSQIFGAKTKTTTKVARRATNTIIQTNSTNRNCHSQRYPILTPVLTFNQWLVLAKHNKVTYLETLSLFLMKDKEMEIAVSHVNTNFFPRHFLRLRIRRKTSLMKSR